MGSVGTFKEYHHRVAQRAPLGLVLGRGLGRRIGCKDPDFVATPGLWRAKTVPTRMWRLC